MKIKTNVRAGVAARIGDRCAPPPSPRCAPTPRCSGSTVYAY